MDSYNPNKHRNLGSICVVIYSKYNMTIDYLIKKYYLFRCDMPRFFIFAHETTYQPEMHFNHFLDLYYPILTTVQMKYD